MSERSEINQKMIDDFRATRGIEGGPMAGRALLLLTTIGARTGLRRTTPLMYQPDGDRFVLFASNIGAPRHPDWFRNLVANPTVTVEVGTETFDAVAAVAEGMERQRLWTRAIEQYPFFTEHQSKTTRVIPLVVLERHKMS
jgi:deazaflavin-dependent oxidoreductase (nitroreductase family)